MNHLKKVTRLFLVGILALGTIHAAWEGVSVPTHMQARAIFVLKCPLKISNKSRTTTLFVNLKEESVNSLKVWEKIDPESDPVEIPIEVAPQSTRTVFLQMPGCSAPRLVASFEDNGFAPLELSFAFNGEAATARSSENEHSYTLEFKATPQNKSMGTWIARQWELSINYTDKK